MLTEEVGGMLLRVIYFKPKCEFYYAFLTKLFMDLGQNFFFFFQTTKVLTAVIELVTL